MVAGAVVASAAWAGAATAARAATETAVTVRRRARGLVIGGGSSHVTYAVPDGRCMICGADGVRGTVGLPNGRWIGVCITFRAPPVREAGDMPHRRFIPY
ncbi:hypothetical protein SRO_3300 [Streptomyces rochei]|nr:hypothetical protein SRO_3300 [Streptomyces rochei]